VFGDAGAAKWEQERAGELQLMLNEGAPGTRGYRRVIIGPDQPYFAGGLPMDAPGVGIGQNDGFYFQARAFLEEVAGVDEAESLPRNASFDEGVHNMEILAAVAESAAAGGGTVNVAPQRAEVTQ
jgi:predicted dehydrogenase